jgi:hypothetical protein
MCACSAQPSWSGAVGSADYAAFERDVYPVLMRDCAYSNCHGAPQRFFQIWGPGRTRLDTNDFRTTIQSQEKLRSFQRTVSMLYTDGSRPLAESPLLVKPLEASSGGSAHGGVDRYGRNVYRSPQDTGYQTLLRWAIGAGNFPSAGAMALPVAGATVPFAGAGAPLGAGALAPVLSAGASAVKPVTAFAGTGATQGVTGTITAGPGLSGVAGASAPGASPIGLGAGAVAGRAAGSAGAGGQP